jgi:hypothetical protein
MVGKICEVERKNEAKEGAPQGRPLLLYIRCIYMLCALFFML